MNKELHFAAFYSYRPTHLGRHYCPHQHSSQVHANPSTNTSVANICSYISVSSWIQTAIICNCGAKSWQYSYKHISNFHLPSFSACSKAGLGSIFVLNKFLLWQSRKIQKFKLNIHFRTSASPFFMSSMVRHVSPHLRSFRFSLFQWSLQANLDARRKSHFHQ